MTGPETPIFKPKKSHNFNIVDLKQKPIPSYARRIVIIDTPSDDSFSLESVCNRLDLFLKNQISSNASRINNNLLNKLINDIDKLKTFVKKESLKVESNLTANLRMENEDLRSCIMN